MYQPPHFVETDPDVLHSLIDEVGTGLLVTSGEGGPTANLLPFRLDRQAGILRAHLARANPQIAELKAGAPLLVVFQAASTYITPSFYKTKQESGKVVPTWNYVMVQVRGRAKITDDAGWLGHQIRDLTDTHEAGLDKPWSVDDAPESYIASQIKGIVGLEIAITAMDGKWKASQNRVEADRQGVAEGLAQRSDSASRQMATLVGRQRDKA